MIPIPGKLYAIGAVLAVLGLVYGAQAWRLHEARADATEARSALLEYQAKAAEVITARLLANQQAEAEQARKNQEVKSAYDSRVAGVRGRYEHELERLRAETAAAGSGSPVPEAPGAAPGASPPTAEQRFVEALRGCEEDRERLTALQAWASGLKRPLP